jgi:hypothetical protein
MSNLSTPFITVKPTDMTPIHFVITGGAILAIITLAPLLLSWRPKHDINAVESQLNQRSIYDASHGSTFHKHKTQKRNLVSNMGETCTLGYDGGDLSTVNPFPKPIVIDPLRPLNYCGEFNSGSCCSNIMAQEITDGFNHLMDVGGTGGVPIDEERCLQYAKKTYVALKDYMCLFCNPRQIKYLGCCNAKYKQHGNCADADGKATDAELMTPYGTGTCVAKKADTIRICKKFATKLWGTDGSKYDHCGMMIWNSHREDILGDDNAWSDDKTAQDGNPVGITPWGDVDGRNGKWPRSLFDRVVFFAACALVRLDLFCLPCSFLFFFILFSRSLVHIHR